HSVALTDIATCTSQPRSPSLHDALPIFDNGDNESLTSKKATPSVSTQIQVTGDGTVGSTTIGDQAIISGGFNVSGGSIHFTLDTPSATAADERTVPMSGSRPHPAPHTTA